LLRAAVRGGGVVVVVVVVVVVAGGTGGAGVVFICHTDKFFFLYSFFSYRQCVSAAARHLKIHYR
jgi:hypothetical protein